MYPTQIHSYLLWRSSVDPDPTSLASRRYTATVSLLPATMVGMFVFGWWAGVVVLISLGTAFVADFLFHKFLFTDATGTRDGTWLLSGLLLAMFMPPNVGWWVPVIGALVAIGVGKYWSAIDNMPLLQPALVGLLALYLIAFAGQSVSPTGKNFMTATENKEAHWPELTRGIARSRENPASEGKAMTEFVEQLLRDFFGGDIRNGISRSCYRQANFDASGTPPAPAVYGPRPIDKVKSHPNYDVSQPLPDSIAKTDPDANEPYDALQMILGYVPGSIGGASAGALFLGILLLVFTGAVHWVLPFFALLTLYGGLYLFAWAFGGSANTPIIVANIDIHMLTGATLLGAFYLAADPTTAPRSLAGKIYAGVAFGLIELFMRLFTPLTEGVVFSVLIVQSVSIVIDQWLAPPVEPHNSTPSVGLTSSTLGRL